MHDNMTVYHGKGDNSAIQTAEFVEIEGVHYALLQLHPDKSSTVIHDALAAIAAPTIIVSEIAQDDGTKTVLCKMDCPPQTVLDALQSQGESLTVEPPEGKTFNPWFWRGATSILGQSLQIASSLTTYNPANVVDGHPTLKPNGSLLGFAVLNLMANACNMTFGSQHKPDAHQLKYLKESFNQQWQAHAEHPDDLPDVNGRAMDRRVEVPLTFGQKAYAAAQAQSVTLGEVGLRMLGTTSLICPITAWPTVFRHLAKGEFAEAGQAAVNPDPVLFKAGIATMVGKVSGLLAKEEDPYNPKPKNAMDIFREKVAFKLSSVIEGGAAAYMMHDRFTNKHSTIGYTDSIPEGFNPEGNMKPDMLGGIGNFVFIDGYIMRYFAKVGSLDVDMKELSAHISDGLAKLPHEAIPDALAATAMGLKLHFHDKKHITVASIYEEVSQDLKVQHMVDVGAIRLANAKQEGQGEALTMLMSQLREPANQGVHAPSYENTVRSQEMLARV